MGGRKKTNKYHGKNQTHLSNAKTNHIEINEEDLLLEFSELYDLLINRTKSLKQLQDDDLCYILSTKWLADWKQYVGYDKFANTEDEEEHKQNKHKKFGKRNPGKINIDIIGNNNQFYTIPEEMTNYTYLNKPIAQKKDKDDDYIAVTQAIWEAFTKRYEGEAILRPIRKLKSSVYYDSDLLKCDVIFIDLKEENLEEKIKKTSKKNYTNLFPSDKMKFSTLWGYQELYLFLAQYCESKYGDDVIRIWKGYSYVATNPIIQAIVESIKQRHTYAIKARLLTLQKYGTKDLDKYLKETHTIIVEIGKYVFESEEEEAIPFGYCEECIEKKKLNIHCGCGEVHYCSAKCKINDLSFHFDTCQVAFDSDDDEEYLDRKIDAAKVPMVGLDNIGNTCYMNSVIQGLLSINFLRQFFTSNVYLGSIDQKQMEDNKGVFVKKISKTFKMISQAKSSFCPWSLKGQVDYFLSPFKGDKQHDANDFLLSFLNVINDFLIKENSKAYHSIIQDNFIGKFTSCVICPECDDSKINQEIFLQISVPIKTKSKQALYNYIVFEDHTRIKKGRSEIKNQWQEMKSVCGSALKYQKSIVCVQKQPQGAIIVDEEEKTPQKLIKGIRGDLIYYPNLIPKDGQHIFVFNLVTTKTICGSTMKSPYGFPILIGVQHQIKSLGTFWLQVIKYFFEKDQKLVQEAKQLELDYMKRIQEITIQEGKELNQSETHVPDQNQKLTKNQKKEEVEKQSQEIKACVASFDAKLKLFVEKCGLEIYICDYKRHKNICRYCNKKCNNCYLALTFDKSFADHFENKYGETKFEVYLRDTAQIQIYDKDVNVKGDPSLVECLELFNQPEQLDEQNAWYCEKCEDMRLAYKQMNIEQFPNFLIIHLNRFKNQNGKKVKNNDPISYHEIQTFAGKSYQLVSAIIHEGSMEGGHYWAICLRNGKYYIFNDHKVTETDKICNKSAYILFYQHLE